MQHLFEDHGIRKPFVDHIATNLIPPRTVNEFYDFPVQQGWFIDEKNYHLRFKRQFKGASPTLGRLLQAWLFFGLIFTVVQKDGKPLMDYSELIVNKGSHVTTINLRGKLEEWATWEKFHPAGQRLRMIRLEAVLQFARRVVQANLACSDTTSPPPGYDTTRHHEHRYVPDKVALSIMILGETLHDFKSRIAQETGMEMRGWKNEDDSGWGPPRFVLTEMERKNVCPRTIHLLRGQLRSNATLLLAALRSVDSNTNAAADHSQCEATGCVVTPEVKGGGYMPTHCNSFCANSQTPAGKCCQSSETPIRIIVDMILCDDKKRPLLRFKDARDGSPDTPELEVVEWHEQMAYATISHVWSDGFGNPKANTMLTCQLGLIRDLLGKLKLEPEPESTATKSAGTERTSIPFWMDTLMIPVGGDDKTQDVRRKSIRQIPEIFKQASHTIVLDWGLHSTDPDVEKPAQTAMRIIASGWMRRLWTLQEAFVSKNLHISQGHDAEALHSLNDLYQELNNKTDGHASTLITAVRNQLQSHVMHQQVPPSRRQETPAPGTNSATGIRRTWPRENAVLVVNAWKAVRWRATANELHETLALASLLDVEFKATAIEDAGLTQPEKVSTEGTAATEARKREKDRDIAMKQFWVSFDVKWPASIPPGIIFLPGARVRIPGFGWAPRTWLSAHEVDFPDPLSFIDSTAELNDPITRPQRGLRVCFPGFLLFAERRSVLFTPNAESRFFRFPVDQGLKEWYKAEAIDDEVSSTFFSNDTSKGNPLAIILSRSRPQEFPPEIGLLVQIYNKADETIHKQTTVTREISGDHQKAVGVAIDEFEEMAFHCEIIRRVKVSRDTVLSSDYTSSPDSPLDGEGKYSVADGGDEAQPYRVPKMLLPGPSDGYICFGETLGPNQVWYVDGWFADWPEASPITSELEDITQNPRPKNFIRALQSRETKTLGSKEAQGSQKEAATGTGMRREQTAGPHSESMLASESQTNQSRSRLKKATTWISSKVKGGRGR